MTERSDAPLDRLKLIEREVQDSANELDQLFRQRHSHEEVKRLLMRLLNRTAPSESAALCGKLNDGKPCQLPKGTNCPDCGPAQRCVAVPIEVMDFLMGCGQLEGRNFGDIGPSNEKYWWRKFIRHADGYRLPYERDGE